MPDPMPDPIAESSSAMRPDVIRLLRLAALVSVVAAVVVVGFVWLVWGLEEFSWHGLAALVLTVVGVTAVNVALIWLMRLSHTSGRDAEAYEGEAWTAARRQETGWQDYKD